MKWKIAMIDAIIVIFCVVLFECLPTKNILMLPLIFALAVGLHLVICSLFSMRKRQNDPVEQMKELLLNDEDREELYWERLNKFDHHPYDNVIGEFTHRWDSFIEKENALQELISLNDNKAKQFLTERSDAAHDFLVANLKKLVKCLIVYNAKSRRNREKDFFDEASTKEVLANVNRLTDLYDQFLEEVSHMKDDINLEDPGLKDAIENLKELRVGQDDEPIDEGRIELKVHPTTHRMTMGGK